MKFITTTSSSYVVLSQVIIFKSSFHLNHKRSEGAREGAIPTTPPPPVRATHPSFLLYLTHFLTPFMPLFFTYLKNFFFFSLTLGLKFYTIYEQKYISCTTKLVFLLPTLLMPLFFFFNFTYFDSFFFFLSLNLSQCDSNSKQNNNKIYKLVRHQNLTQPLYIFVSFISYSFTVSKYEFLLYPKF